MLLSVGPLTIGSGFFFLPVSCETVDYGKLLLHVPYIIGNLCSYDVTGTVVGRYVVGFKSFRPDIEKPHQIENTVRDI